MRFLKLFSLKWLSQLQITIISTQLELNTDNNSE